MTNPQHEALVEVLRNLHQAESLCRYVVLHGAMSHTDEQVWTGLREAGDAARATLAALSATAATPSDEVVRLRAALQAVSEGDVPRTEGKKWREDGAPSKHDQCSHGMWIYEDCGECTSAFARAALEPQGKDL